MLFALICTDKPNSLELRQQSRPDHLKFLESLGSNLKAAGPFTDDEGKPTGSLVVIEAQTARRLPRSRRAIPMRLRGFLHRLKSSHGNG